MKQHVTGGDELSVTFTEMRGHFYMHAGTLLLKMAQQSEVHWRAVSELAALSYLIAFQVSCFQVMFVLSMLSFCYTKQVLLFKEHCIREVNFILKKLNVTSTSFAAELIFNINFYQVPKPKSKLIKGDQAEQEKLEMLACDRQSQSGNKNKYWNSL